MLLLFIINQRAQAQEFELNQILSMQSKTVASELELFQGDTVEDILSQSLKNEVARKTENLKSATFQTYNVQIVYYGGFNFHVADYIDGTRIVTCLDGTEKGLQSIAHNGTTQMQSRNVQWHNGYFIHFYPGGKVTSFPNNQVAEIY